MLNVLKHCHSLSYHSLLEITICLRIAALCLIQVGITVVMIIEIMNAIYTRLFKNQGCGGDGKCIKLRIRNKLNITSVIVAIAKQK